MYTTIYASNFSKEREILWKELVSLHQSLQLSGVLWVVGGDLNQIMHPSAHSRPNINHLTSQIVELRDCFIQLGVFDLRFRGSFHTWTNKRPSGPITENIDKLLVNNSWLAAYPNSVATFSAPYFSDHSPCCLVMACQLPSAGTKPFRFFNFLTKHPSFCQTVHVA